MKKIAALLLLVLMLISLLPVNVMAEPSVIEINSKEDFLNYLGKDNFASYSNNTKHYELKTDIDLGEYKPYTGATYFSGTFNGNGYTITYKMSELIENGLYSSAGLFFAITGGTVTNLNICCDIKGTSNNSNISLIGALSSQALLVNISNVTIATNSKIEVNLNIDKDKHIYHYIGGVAGAILKSHVENVINNANITLNYGTNSNISYIGGIIGYINKNMPGSIINATNNGKITINCNGYETKELYAAGIAGYVEDNLYNCTNNGKVKINDLCTNNNNVNNYTCIGGVVGKANNANLSTMTNTGSVTVDLASQSDSLSIGGIAGKFSNGELKYAKNTGIVTFDCDSKKIESCSIGGIAGGTAYAAVSDCINTGFVYMNNCCFNRGGYVGGISGTSYKSHLEKVHNEGDVELTANSYCEGFYAAGITGYITQSEFGTLIDGSNTGDITIDFKNGQIYGYGAGGIAGIISDNVYNCYNEGNITIKNLATVTSQFLGGISALAMADSNNREVVNCYNAGTITSLNVDYSDTLIGFIFPSGKSFRILNSHTLSGDKVKYYASTTSLADYEELSTEDALTKLNSFVDEANVTSPTDLYEAISLKNWVVRNTYPGFEAIEEPSDDPVIPVAYEDTKAVPVPSSVLERNGIPIIYTGDEEQEIKVMTLVDTYINGNNQFSANAPIFIENGRTYLGIRDMAYALNIAPEAIKWDDKTKTASISKSGAVLEVTEGSSVIKMTYKGYIYEIESDASAKIKNDRIYLPFRIIFEQFGYKVDWDNETRIITCTKNK